MAQSSYQKLYAKGLKFLSHRPYSERELAAKLIPFGDPEEILQVLTAFKAINLINDFDFARNYASYKVRSRRLGRARAVVELRKRKVPEPVIEQALDEVFKEVDEETLLDQAVEKWLQRAGKPKQAKELQRMIRFLQRQGFPSERLYAKLSVYFSELERSEDATEETD